MEQDDSRCCPSVRVVLVQQPGWAVQRLLPHWLWGFGGSRGPSESAAPAQGSCAAPPVHPQGQTLRLG